MIRDEETTEWQVLTARVPRDFALQVLTLAQDERRSVSNMVMVLLDEALDARDQDKLETRNAVQGGGA